MSSMGSPSDAGGERGAYRRAARKRATRAGRRSRTLACTHTHPHRLRRVSELVAQCLSTNTLTKSPTKAARLLIKPTQNVTPSPNDA
ncbi:hypothetical protein EVAR_59295_1 [Eumeta japonica]|uniref:Uncharacterized protein n=1 Tax=Eumeta variegata TaxID=151549 RepID=A0A4C1Y8A0_EUMVA|nr:hypothetical protein EVAR_59295_1 [Eumeta japonica]